MRRLLVLLLAIIVLPAVALMGGAVPVPAPTPSMPASADDARHRIHVLSNGFHAAIALPADAWLPPEGQGKGQTVMAALGLDPARHPVDPDAVRHWLIGWGSQTAYTSLREVRDLTVGMAAQALAFDDTVMHVQPLGAFGEGRPGLYAIDISSAQLSALIASIERSFAATEPFADITQGFGDRFFAGHGRFSPLITCNTWVGRRLRDGGIGVGLWTPTAQTLEFSLARLSSRQAR